MTHCIFDKVLLYVQGYIADCNDHQTTYFRNHCYADNTQEGEKMDEVVRGIEVRMSTRVENNPSKLN